MSVSLYRQYRPQKFSEVVGQGAAIDVLVHALAHSRVGHAYLFSGPRGCGKTSVARILAKALNCRAPDGTEPCGHCPSCAAITAGESLDVVEIDGASNNSVDEVRELKSHVALAPFASKYKVYIIDEVHMLSAAAFNALLKTLEEPPDYVVFILATTEPHKVPVTIRSRCQHIPFHSIGAKDIFGQLQRVCEAEGASAQPEALWEVARQADGAMRDGLSMLEQVINRASGEVSLADVEAALGAGSRPALERWLAGLREGAGTAYLELKRMMEEGTSPQRLFEELFSLVRNLWLAACWPETLVAMDISEQERDFIRREAPSWEPSVLQALLEALVRLITQARLGVRAEVLTGILMLDAARLLGPDTPRDRRPAPSPRPSAPAAEPPQSPPVPAAAPVPSAPEAPPPGTPLAEDAWEATLARLKEENLVLHCALLDAAPREAEGRLTLVMGHRYCYETLRLERNSAALSGFFPQYEGVVLSFEGAVSPCAAPGPVRAKPAPAVPEPPVDEPVEPVEERTSPSPREEGAPPDALPFAGLIQEVSRLMRGEVVLVRHGLGPSGDEDEGEEENEE